MNHLEDQLAGLATLEVPVRVDAAQTVRAGRRVVHRRRVAAAAGVSSLGVFALAVAPSAVRSVVSDQISPAPAPADATSETSAPARVWKWADIASEASFTEWPKPGAELRLERVADAAGAGYGYGPASENGGAGELLGSLALRHGKAVGHVSLVIREAASDLCATPLHPSGGTGRTCTPGSDERGPYAVIEWAGSDQGPTRMVRAFHNGWVASLTIALGRATYSDVADDPTLLPRDLGDPDQPGSGPATERPQLAAYPFSTDKQTELAWSYLGAWVE